MTHWSERHKVVPAVFVILERKGRVLLMRRANTGYMDGFYSLPAGHLDGGEPASIAAARECKEEVGLTVDPAMLEIAHVTHRLAAGGDHERMDVFFKVTQFEGEPANMEPHKCDELRWVAYNALPKNMVPEVRVVLERVQAGQTYSEYNFS